MESEVTNRRTLVPVRHAKSSWDYDVDDHERPLSGRGRRDAEALGQLLSQRSLRPDLVFCSTATRTRQTWGTQRQAVPVRVTFSISMRSTAPGCQSC